MAVLALWAPPLLLLLPPLLASPPPLLLGTPPLLLLLLPPPLVPGRGSGTSNMASFRYLQDQHRGGAIRPVHI